MSNEVIQQSEYILFLLPHFQSIPRFSSNQRYKASSLFRSSSSKLIDAYEMENDFIMLLLKDLSFLLPFSIKFQLFNHFLSKVQSEEDDQSAMSFMGGGGPSLSIQRDSNLTILLSTLENYKAMKKKRHKKNLMRQNWKISFKFSASSDQGQSNDEDMIGEAGIDGGGLYREYLQLISKILYGYPFFYQLNHSGNLHINKTSKILDEDSIWEKGSHHPHITYDDESKNSNEMKKEEEEEEIDFSQGRENMSEDQLYHYQLISNLSEEDILTVYELGGVIFGKILVNKFLIPSHFSILFLNLLKGSSSLNTLDNLKEYDPEIYSYLISLRDMDDEEIDQLDLYFEDYLPNNSTFDENGKRITRENKRHFIHQFSHYLLNLQSKTESSFLFFISLSSHGNIQRDIYF